MLTGCDLSLFVIGSSCDQDGGGMLPLQIITMALPPKKKTVRNRYAGRPAQTICGRARRGTGGNNVSL